MEQLEKKDEEFIVNERKKITRERKRLLQKRLKEQVKPQMHQLYKASVLSWIQFLMRIISFGVIADIFYRLYTKQEIAIGTASAVLIGCNLVGFIVAMLSKKFQGVASQYARNRIKRDFFNAFESKEGLFDEQFSTVDILTIASQGIDSLDTYYQHYLTTTLRVYLNCLTILVVVASFFPVGAVLFVVSIPLIPISIVLMQKRSQKIMQRYWSSYMDVGNLFMDDLRGLNTLYSYQAMDRYEKTFVEKAEDFRLSTMELLGFQLQSVGYMDAVMYLGVGVSGFVGTLFLSQGHMSVFHMIFFVLIATEFFAPIRELGYCMHLLMMNTKMADRIFTFLDACKQPEQRETASVVLENIEHISVENVAFKYEDNTLLENITFNAAKGQLLAIAGESGTGKTTLSKILLKQLTDYTGSVLINDVPLRDISKETILEQMALVSPSSYVMNTTILDNLQLGTQKTREEIETWIQQHDVLQFVHKLPDGLDTYVGENGRLLSPGQRQQMICMRALLADKSVYLFDEMTSSVDVDNESTIFEFIKWLAKEHVVLFISHKMKQVQQADHVVFLSNKGATVGMPTELYASNEQYRHMVDTQLNMEGILHGK